MDGGPRQDPPHHLGPSYLALQQQQQQPQETRAFAIKTEWVQQEAGLGARPAAVQGASVGAGQGTLEAGSGRPGGALQPWDRGGGWCRDAIASRPPASSAGQQGQSGEEVPSEDTQQQQQQHSKRARKQTQPQPVRARTVGGVPATMPSIPVLGLQQQQQQQQPEGALPLVGVHVQPAAAGGPGGAGNGREGLATGARVPHQQEQEPQAADAIGVRLWKQLRNGWRRLFDSSNPQPKCLSLPVVVVEDLELEEDSTATFVHEELGTWEVGVARNSQNKWRLQRGYRFMHRDLKVKAGDTLVLEKVPQSEWVQDAPTVRISIERGPSSTGGAAAAGASLAAPEAVEDGSRSNAKRKQTELQEEEGEWSQDGEEEGNAAAGGHQQEEGHDVAAASPQQASASAATNGRSFRRRYRYLRVPAPPPGCPPVPFGNAAGREWWLHSDESVSTRLKQNDVERCLLQFKWVVAERLRIKHPQPLTLIVQGSGGGQWDAEVGGGQARQYTLQRHFGKMLWDLNAQGGDLIRFWPLRPGPAGHMAQMVVALERAVKPEGQQEEQALNAASDDGVLFGKGPGISRIWRRHPDGSLSTVLSVTPTIQSLLPIRSSVAAALGLHSAQKLELVQEGSGRSWEVELAGGPTYKLQGGVGKVLRDVGAQGADTIRLWPAVAGGEGKPSQLRFALEPQGSRQQEGSGPAAGLSVPLLVQAQPLSQAPALAGSLPSPAQGAAAQLPGPVASGKQGQGQEQGSQRADAARGGARFWRDEGWRRVEGGVECVVSPGHIQQDLLPLPESIKHQLHVMHSTTQLRVVDGGTGRCWDLAVSKPSEQQPFTALQGLGPLRRELPLQPWDKITLQPAADLRQLPACYISVQPGSVPQQAGASAELAANPVAAPGSRLLSPLPTPQQQLLQTQSAGVKLASAPRQSSPSAAQMQGSGWQPREQAGQETSSSAQAGYGPWTPTPARTAWPAQQAQQRSSGLQSSSQGGNGNPSPFSSSLGGGGSGNVSGSPAGISTAYRVGTPAAAVPGPGRAVQREQQASDPFAQLAELQEVLEQAALTPPELSQFEQAWLGMTAEQQGSAYRAVMRAAAEVAAGGSRELLRQAVQAAITGAPAAAGAGDDPFLMLNELQGALQQASLPPNVLLDLELAWLDMSGPQRRAIHSALMRAAAAAAPGAAAVVQEMAARAVDSVRAGGQDAHEALCRLQDMCTEGQVEAALLSRLELAWLGQRSCHWFASMERMLGRASSQGREALCQAVAAVVRSSGGGSVC